MKSHSDSLLNIAGGILKDVSLAYPEYRGVGRDFKRLTLLVKERGLGVFTLDLPSREQSLLEGLDSGRLRSSGTLVYSKKYRVPRLFAGLYMRIFDKNLCLREDADVNAVAFLRQLLALGKKTEVPCSKKRELQSVEEYIHVEQELIPPTLRWADDFLGLDGNVNNISLCNRMVTDLPLFPELNAEDNGRIKLLLQRCQRTADFVAQELGTFCPDCFVEARQSEGKRLGLRHGPGAVAERSGRYFDKYRFSNWPAKLSRLFPKELFGKFPNSELVTSLNEVPSRLISVPKTAKGPRLIAAEPSEHQWCQQLIREWLDHRIKSSFLRDFIDFQDQSKSGEMALKASLDRSLATIDLSSASDRLSLWVVERIFRSNPSILKAIHAVRTRWIYVPHKGEYIKLKKFASQGTAITFPVQTLVFLVLALACANDGPITRSSLGMLRGRVRVFGDDIIIPNDRYADMVDVLSRLQLKVNESKSFRNGHFRESCGTDGFKGYDVTPIKPKTTISDGPASCSAVLDTLNNLFYKGYWNASEQLKYRLDIDPRSRFPIVGRGAGATGYGSYSLYSAMRRYHRLLPTTSSGSVPAQVRRSGQYSRRISSAVCLPPHLLRGILGADWLRRLRWNRALARFEVRVPTIWSRSKVRPYDCGYSGLLGRAISPRDPQGLYSLNDLGVPERPSTRNGRRWVDLITFCYEGYGV